MKTRLISLNYRGTASVDPRFSAAMLPWTINDIRSIESYTKLSVGIENGILESYNSDFELQFSHPLKHVVGMCRIIHKASSGKQVGNGFLQLKNQQQTAHSSSNQNATGGPGMKASMKTSNSYGSLATSLSQREQHQHQHQQQQQNHTCDCCNDNNLANNFMEFTGPITGLVYLMKEPKDPLLHIYLFECDAVEEMAELMHQMHDPAHTLGGSVGSIPQTLISSNGTSPDLSIQKALAENATVHITPATNLQLREANRISNQNESNPNLKSNIMKSSKSYTQGLSNSAGTVHIPTSTSAQGNLSLLADISPNHTHFFEVMYVGKIRVSSKRVQHTFIDDALPKFKAFDAQRARLMQLSTANTANTVNTANSKTSINSDGPVVAHSNADVKGSTLKESDEENLKVKSIEEKSEKNDCNVDIKKPDEADGASESSMISPRSKLRRGISHTEIIGKRDKQNEDGNTEQDLEQSMDNIPIVRDRSASYGCIPPYVEQNRTMVFLVGRSDLRLISPDRKQVLLYRNFKDVASCAQGQKNADHFGIICRESHNDGYMGYVFKCQSENVCDDIVSAISQAFVTCAQQKRKESTQIFSCEHCPMLWYHKLCSDVEGLSEKKTQHMIFRRIDSLTDDEQNTIWAKFHGSEKLNSPLGEQNQFLMMLLRAHCESRQQRHVHESPENRLEFINQYLGGNTIFMKAKRSLTNSFDHLLKRKTSKDDILTNSNTLTIKEQDHSIDRSKLCIESTPDNQRSRSSTLASSPGKEKADQLKSPMMDIFLKVGNTPQGSEAHQGSWRQAILNSVVTPSKNFENTEQADLLSPMRLTHGKTGKRTRDDLRELWKTATRQIILLRRMETENAMLQARQNEHELKRMKLDYDDITKADKQQLIEQWERFLENSTQSCDVKILRETITSGVPRSKRGEVWLYLAEQFTNKSAIQIDTDKFPNFYTPYHVLLKNLTEHQHAIFIDLGRTFPNHKFYKDPLGLGQLSLFNLLKAYSILDPELGYCQGLGFLCGVLLLHCDEAEAFHLLKHLMFYREMRCKYLPDMKNFQLQLYQLSRLVKDHLPELYIWLDQNDVSPTLYAAPWILTVFSSQFPLGFVARVFDLLFLDSSEVIFKFALSLLTIHKKQLLLRDNFEDIMDYFKTVIPIIDNITMDRITAMAFSLNLNKQLMEYNTEYNVLQEEIQTTNHHLDLLNKEKTKNQHLEQQLQFAQSSVAQLEKAVNAQQTHIMTLQKQIQTLEGSFQTLGHYLGKLNENGSLVDVPSDVRCILQQLDDMNKQKRKPLFTERKIGKSVSVNSHLGFPLKVLEELNEKDEHGSPQKLKKEKTHFFEHAYEQLRHTGGQTIASHRRPQSLYDNRTLHAFNSDFEDDRYTVNIKIPQEVDSGMGTPLSPPSSSSCSSSSNDSHSSSSSICSRSYDKNTAAILEQEIETSEMIRSQQNRNDDINKGNIEEMGEHPLSMVGDVHVKFNGTTQLKSWRPVNHIKMKYDLTNDTINRSNKDNSADLVAATTLSSILSNKTNCLEENMAKSATSATCHS